MENRTREIRERCLLNRVEAEKLLGLKPRSMESLEKSTKATYKHRMVWQSLEPHIVIHEPEKYTINRLVRLYLDNNLSVHQIATLSRSGVELIRLMIECGEIRNKMTLYKAIYALEGVEESKKAAEKLTSIIKRTNLTIARIAKEVGLHRVEIERAMRYAYPADRIEEITKLVINFINNQEELEVKNGDELKEFRKRLGLTTHNMIYMFGVSANYLRELERLRSFNGLTQKRLSLIRRIIKEAPLYAERKGDTEAKIIREQAGITARQAYEETGIRPHVISAAEQGLSTPKDYHKYLEAITKLSQEIKNKKKSKKQQEPREVRPAMVKRTILNEAW